MGKTERASVRPDTSGAAEDTSSAPSGHVMEATAARAFASLIAPMPEPASPDPEVDAQKAQAAVAPKGRPGALTPEMIRRIADRAEAAARKK